MAQNFSKGEAVSFGWNAIKSNLGFFIMLMIIVFAIFGVLSAIDGALKETAPFLSILVNLVSTALNVLIGMGLIKISLKLCDGQKPGFGDLFSCAGLFWKNLAASLIYMAIILLGTLLLIVPGIIWGIMFQFCTYFIVDKGVGPIESLRNSAAATKGSKWNLFLFGLILGAVNLLGVLALIVGIFITIPLSMLATAYVYRKLSADYAPAA